MKALKKFWLFILALFPISAGAMGPVAVGAIGGAVGILGVSIWRSASPVNTKDAFDFFSSCWTCHIFSDVMETMSNLLPGVYHSLAEITIPIIISLLVVLMAWRLTSSFINAKLEEPSKFIGNFGYYLVKIALAVGLLLMPLPRTITEVIVEPIVTIGTSFDSVISKAVNKDNNIFSECMVATAIADPFTMDKKGAKKGAFSPNLRHQLTCEVANIHQVTGLGMTVGWTMLNMAFNSKYMYKLLFGIPVFPNLGLAAAGLLLLVLYFLALLPIPLFFLEVFINLSMDLIMLPLMLMAWVFDEDNFAIFPKGGKTIRQMIDDVIKGIVGIGLTVVFLGFTLMFLDAAFGNWQGAGALQQVIDNGDSNVLLDGLMMNNDSFITVLLMGIFLAMFLTMIPQLTNMLFKVKISDKYYQTAKNDLNILWGGVTKFVTGKKSDLKGVFKGRSNTSVGGHYLGSNGADSNSNYTRLAYIETSGVQYIDTLIKPNDNTCVMMEVRMKGVTESFLFGARDGANSFAMKVFHEGNASSIYDEYGSSSDSSDVGQPLTGDMVVDMKKEYTAIEGIGVPLSTAISHQNVSFFVSNNLYLFGVNDNGHCQSRSSCLFSGCAIYNNRSMVRDFIPVLDKNGTPCLYDIIEKKFYYNKGAGRFIAGPAV